MWIVRGAVPHPEGHDVTGGDDLLAEQVAYYRRRAAEYDVTAYGDLYAAAARINRIVAALRPARAASFRPPSTSHWSPATASASSSVESHQGMRHARSGGMISKESRRKADT